MFRHPSSEPDLEELIRESDHQEAHEGAMTKRVWYQVDEVENDAAEGTRRGKVEVLKQRRRKH